MDAGAKTECRNARSGSDECQANAAAALGVGRPTYRGPPLRGSKHNAKPPRRECPVSSTLVSTHPNAACELEFLQHRAASDAARIATIQRPADFPAILR